jgi:hypothetical protein
LSGIEVGVERVEGALAPVVLEDDVAPVIAMRSGLRDVNHAARCNGEDVVEGFAFGITMQRFDVEALMKTGVGDLAADAPWVAHKTKLPAFPRRGSLSFKGAVHELVKLRASTAEKGVIFGGKAQFESADLSGEEAGKQNAEEKKAGHKQKGSKAEG